MKFTLIRELDDGERIPVAVYGSLMEAEHQAEALSEFWPGTYVIRETALPGRSCGAPPEHYAGDSRC